MDTAAYPVFAIMRDIFATLGEIPEPKVGTKHVRNCAVSVRPVLITRLRQIFESLLIPPTLMH